MSYKLWFHHHQLLFSTEPQISTQIIKLVPFNCSLARRHPPIWAMPQVTIFVILLFKNISALRKNIFFPRNDIHMQHELEKMNTVLKPENEGLWLNVYRYLNQWEHPITIFYSYIISVKVTVNCSFMIAHNKRELVLFYHKSIAVITYK